MAKVHATSKLRYLATKMNYYNLNELTNEQIRLLELADEIEASAYII